MTGRITFVPFPSTRCELPEGCAEALERLGDAQSRLAAAAERANEIADREGRAS